MLDEQSQEWSAKLKTVIDTLLVELSKRVWARDGMEQSAKGIEAVPDGIVADGWRCGMKKERRVFVRKGPLSSPRRHRACIRSRALYSSN